MKQHVKLRRPSHATVVAYLALFIAIGGTSAFAASQLGKNSVGPKQLKKNSVTTAKIKKNAVTKPKIKKNAVTSAKIAKGAVTNAKLGDAAVNLAKIAPGTNVIGSVSGGPVSAKQDGPVNPLNAPLTITPVAGQPITVSMEARATLTQIGMNSCVVIIRPVVNGNALGIGEGGSLLVSPDNPPNEVFPNGIPQIDVAFPLGLTHPGQTLNVTVQIFGGETECTAGSTVDQVSLVATQLK
jgi:hypothetical protein